MYISQQKISTCRRNKPVVSSWDFIITIGKRQNKSEMDVSWVQPNSNYIDILLTGLR